MSNATRARTEGYSKVVTWAGTLSRPHCKDVASGPQVLLDESGNAAYGDAGNLQVHITGVYRNSGTATEILSS